MDNLTMVSYGYLIRRPGTYPGENGKGRGDLRKAEVMDRPIEECRSTFPYGQLNESYVECVAGLGFAYWVIAIILYYLYIYIPTKICMFLKITG